MDEAAAIAKRSEGWAIGLVSSKPSKRSLKRGILQEMKLSRELPKPTP
jgi:phosphoribosylanthranilate isomerase